MTHPTILKVTGLDGKLAYLVLEFGMIVQQPSDGESFPEARSKVSFGGAVHFFTPTPEELIDMLKG